MIDKFKSFEGNKYEISDFKKEIMSQSSRALDDFNFKLVDYRRYYIDIYQYGLIDKIKYYIGFYNVTSMNFVIYRDRNKKFNPEKVINSPDFWSGLDKIYYLVYQD